MTSFNATWDDVVKINVTPRFGKLFSYLLNYATNIYIAPSELNFQSSNRGKGSYWLLGLLWRGMLKKALTEGMIPKEYIKVTENRKSYKGRLNVRAQIRNNIVDSSRFVCNYKKLSLDNTINRTVRYTYKILLENKLDGITKEFFEYDKRLESFGVSNNEVSIGEIAAVRYNKLTAPYESFMRVCKSIICQHKTEEMGFAKNSFSFFIDIAELWEVYLLKLLKANLPDYNVYSPNSSHGQFLLDNKIREIRPDIIIEKEGRIVMIIDAKYKRYSCLGSTSARGVSREDLYQMSTYLYHYGKQGETIYGIFTSPFTPDSHIDLHTYSNNPHHHIGLINLSVEGCEDEMAQIKTQESLYINNILERLSQIS